MKLFLAEIHEFSQLIRVLVPGNLFQPCVMSVSKARTNPSEETFCCSTLGYSPGTNLSESISGDQWSSSYTLLIQ
jgi:hypothetical protein